MVFWTWARRLEDTFDGKNRQNLRRFIIQETEKMGSPVMLSPTGQFSAASGDRDDMTTDNASDEAATTSMQLRQEPPMYFLARVKSPKVTIRESLNDNEGEKDASGSYVQKELPRIMSCAVFHKLTHGRGVPHAFINFIRHWPSMPHVVIFMSVRVLPTARVPLQERYEITRVRTLQGFYGVTYSLGYMDNFLVDINDVIDLICIYESRADPQNAEKKTQNIREAAQISTHIVPHYHVWSRPLEGGRFNYLLSQVRKFLLESVYQQISGMFPETSNWAGNADEIIRIGVNASI